jgi:iron complex transport system substrate-binding protein
MAALAVQAGAEPRKPTIVSLDYCADQYVLALADRGQILALSKDAEREFSYLRAEAANLPKVRAAAEDVIALSPDIVVRSWGGDARALAFFERFGIDTVQVGYAENIPGTVESLRAVAREIGQAERAESLIAAMPPAAPSMGAAALYVTPGGVSAGSGTMINAIMTRAGLGNANAGAGWTRLPLEQLVRTPPQLMLTAFFGFDDDATDHWSPSRHPVMQRAIASAKTVALDEASIACPGWFAAAEAARVRAVLEAAP